MRGLRVLAQPYTSSQTLSLVTLQLLSASTTSKSNYINKEKLLCKGTEEFLFLVIITKKF